MTFSGSTCSRALTVGFIVVATTLLHASIKVEKSDPPADAVVAEPPYDVQLFFNEPPDMKVSKMDIKGPSKTIKLTLLHDMGNSWMAVVEGDMPDGAYTVEWQSAGDDGNVQK